MKGFVLVLLLAVLLCGASSADAIFRGEYCWDIGTGDILRLFVNDVGGGNYLLNGKCVFTDGRIASMIGNAEIAGSSIYITLTHTQTDTPDVNGIHATISRIVLDSTTLNGTRESFTQEHYYDDSNAENNYPGFNSGTLTHITCP